jgi:hypothetical protein
MNDHYFGTILVDQAGAAIPERRFATLQGAMAYMEGLSGAAGDIVYRDEPDSPLEVMVHYSADGGIDAPTDPLDGARSVD